MVQYSLGADTAPLSISALSEAAEQISSAAAAISTHVRILNWITKCSEKPKNWIYTIHVTKKKKNLLVLICSKPSQYADFSYTEHASSSQPW